MLRALLISLAVSVGLFFCMVFVGEKTSSPETLESSVLSFSDIKYSDEGAALPTLDADEFTQVLSKTGEIIEKETLTKNGSYSQILQEDGTIIDFSN